MKRFGRADSKSLIISDFCFVVLVLNISNTMKFNDREIIMKANEPADIEGVLHYLRPQNNEWSNWYSAPSFKERKFKLVANMLFYYRIGEQEPLGVIILENAEVKSERPSNGVVFPFSIEFSDEQQHKYIFSCRCQEEVNNWVLKLKTASYEYWRTQLIILQKKISMRTGKEPATIYTGNQAAAERLSWVKKQVGAGKSTFQCHLNDSDNLQLNYNAATNMAVINKTPSNSNTFLVNEVKKIDLNSCDSTSNNVKKNDPPIDDLIKF